MSVHTGTKVQSPISETEKDFEELQVNDDEAPLQCQDLSSCLKKLKPASLEMATTAATETIMNPAYTLTEFERDCKEAFPELELYRVGEMVGGRSGEEECQRTFAALYHVYWLVRMEYSGTAGSGKDGISFGVDDDGKSKTAEGEFEDEEAKAKRQAFHDNRKVWEKLKALTEGAGFMDENKTQEERISLLRSMLALTAIHDIMKISILLPPSDAEAGFTKTYDHDIALSYVLGNQQKYPLPSYRMLPQDNNKRKVQLTLGKMNFNFGWMVQTEAPPKALFADLKTFIEEMPVQDREESLLFYFFHWFTDLAGAGLKAGVHPLRGCEKFILEFPTVVLLKFFDAMSHVQNLAGKSETAVYFEYLQSTSAWQFVTDELTKADGGGLEQNEAIALTRLILMSQNFNQTTKDAFTQLDPTDRTTLVKELSLTGNLSDPFQAPYNPSGISGPAFTVYYGPALLQNWKPKSKYAGQPLKPGMQLLAQIFAKAREKFQTNTDYTKMIMLQNNQELADFSVSPDRFVDSHLLVDTDGEVCLTKDSSCPKAPKAD